MRRYRRFLCAAAALLIGALVTVFVIEWRAQRTPLSVGATADEAWAYIHSPAAYKSRSFLFDITRVGWQAHAVDIQCDVRYSVQCLTSSLFATRHVVYRLNTNGTTVGMKSSWKWVSPLVFGARTEPAPSTTYASSLANAPWIFQHRHPDGVSGPILPLAPEQLLGARSAQERDDLAEAVARYCASELKPAPKRLSDMPQPDRIFVGFRDTRMWEGTLYAADCDFPPQLLRRLNDLKPRVRPVSSADWGRYDPRSGFVDSDDSARGMTCIIRHISLISGNEAEAEVRSTSGFYSRTTNTTYQLVRMRGKWTVTSGKLTGMADR